MKHKIYMKNYVGDSWSSTSYIGPLLLHPDELLEESRLIRVHIRLRTNKNFIIFLFKLTENKIYNYT